MQFLFMHDYYKKLFKEHIAFISQYLTGEGAVGSIMSSLDGFALTNQRFKLYSVHYANYI